MEEKKLKRKERMKSFFREVFTGLISLEEIIKLKPGADRGAVIAIGVVVTIAVAVRAYFPTQRDLEEADLLLSGFATNSLVTSRAVPDEDWNRKWRETMRPVLVAPGVWASPRWLKPPLGDGEHWLRI